MKKNLILFSALVLTGAMALSSCKKDKEEETPPTTTTPTPGPSLYTRVGGTTLVADKANPGQMIEAGRQTLRSVVDSAIFVIAGDPKMAKFFPVLLGEVGAGNLTGFSKLSKNFTDFLSDATGRPGAKLYAGLSMADAHNTTKNGRMGVTATNADFDAFMTDIVAALAKNGVTSSSPASDTKLLGDLGALLETTRTTIVQAPTLYERVGGKTMKQDPTKPAGTMIEAGRLTLRSVVDSAIFVIAGDAKMAKFFPVLLGEVGAGNTTGFNALSKNFTDFLVLATGRNGAVYAGKSMKDAHNPATNSRMGDKATNADFDAFVGDIGTALAKNGVTSANNKALVDDLVALLNTTRADIVQK